MSVEISITIRYECDECGESGEYDAPEPMTEEEINEYIESEGWEFRDGKLLCPDCACEEEEDEEIKPFMDRCYTCIRSIEGYDGLFCPHFKNKCESLAYSMEECPDFQTIGEKREKGPKYKPIENCSLIGFVEGIE